MIDATAAFQLLIGSRNLLWRDETRHEAMLLLDEVWDRITEAERAYVVAHILRGSPEPEEKEVVQKENDRQVFELLAFIARKHENKFPESALNEYKRLEKKGYSTDPDYPGMRRYIVVGDVRRRPTGALGFKFSDLEPSEAVGRLLDYKDTYELSQRDVAEAFGNETIESPAWGIAALLEVRQRLDDVPADLTGPILWGIRACAKTKGTGSTELVKPILESLQDMVTELPDPNRWSSLPSVLQELESQGVIRIRDWGSLATALAKLFLDFDYDRESNSEKVEWIQRSINHPCGHLVQMFLTLAQVNVRRQSDAKESPSLLPECRDIFSIVLSRYGVGSRYGLCLLSERVSWFDAVDHDWTDAYLLPEFQWREDQEASLVAWSGFLWSRHLYRPLVHDFENSYMGALSRISHFGNSEIEGLAAHIAAIFWFHDRTVRDLENVIRQSDGAFRIKLVREIARFLPNAEPGPRDMFLEEYIIPLWKWLQIGDWLSGDIGNRLRLALFELLPFSGNKFTAIGTIALKKPPEPIEGIGQILAHLADSNLVHSNSELFTSVLLALLNADSNPIWNNNYWKRLWDVTKSIDSPTVSKFQNELAARNAIEV